MRVVQMTVAPDENGVLRFEIPTGAERASQYRLAVVITPVDKTAKQKTPEELGWPPGYFENVVGSIDDETFCRPPQPVWPADEPAR